jgi:hypothetical protein
MPLLSVIVFGDVVWAQNLGSDPDFHNNRDISCIIPRREWFRDIPTMHSAKGMVRRHSHNAFREGNGSETFPQCIPRREWFGDIPTMNSAKGMVWRHSHNAFSEGNGSETFPQCIQRREWFRDIPTNRFSATGHTLTIYRQN